YIRVARVFLQDGIDLAVLERLADPVDVDGTSVPFFSRSNPIWLRRGVLVPVEKKDGSIAISLRNARQTREAVSDVILERLGLMAASSSGVDETGEVEDDEPAELAHAGR